MKNIKFLVLGIFFAIVLSKVQAISWFRFYEMFKFQSFHMFGIIGGAIVVSSLIMKLFKSGSIKDINGNKIIPKPKKKGFIRTLVGGTFFGLGWGVSGACAVRQSKRGGRGLRQSGYRGCCERLWHHPYQRELCRYW